MSAIAELTKMLYDGRRSWEQCECDFTFLAIGADRAVRVTNSAKFLVSFMVIGHGRKRAEIRDAFARRFSLKDQLPTTDEPGALAYCEEDRGFYFYNGQRWVCYGHRTG